MKKYAYTILIVEDDEVSFSYLDILLNRFLHNLKILRAKHGQEAVEKCKIISDIDFVLMDLKMPIMNGFEATKLIKEFRPDLPIVIQTAYSMMVDTVHELSSDCDGFISKPIRENNLREIVNKYMIIDRQRKV